MFTLKAAVWLQGRRGQAAAPHSPPAVSVLSKLKVIKKKKSSPLLLLFFSIPYSHLVYSGVPCLVNKATGQICSAINFPEMLRVQSLSLPST